MQYKYAVFLTSYPSLPSHFPPLREQLLPHQLLGSAPPIRCVPHFMSCTDLSLHSRLSSLLGAAALFWRSAIQRASNMRGTSRSHLLLPDFVGPARSRADGCNRSSSSLIDHMFRPQIHRWRWGNERLYSDKIAVAIEVSRGAG